MRLNVAAWGQGLRTLPDNRVGNRSRPFSPQSTAPGRLAASSWPRRTLGTLVGGGIAIRAWFIFSRPSAYVGYPDARTYVMAARGPLFWNPYRPAGYPVFLRAVHAADSRLTVVVAVQHGLGAATALLLYGTTARFLRRRWMALLPASVVLFGGSQLFLEHSVMSEGPYTFLLIGALYCAARSVDASVGGGWLAGAGAILGVSATMRSNGVLVIPTLAGWALTRPRAGLRKRVSAAGNVVLGATVPLAAYLVAQHRATGVWSLTRTSGFTLYARMAPIADRRGFLPPPETRELCEPSRPQDRQNPTWYMFDRDSPALKLYGVPPYPLERADHDAYRWEGNEPLRRFAGAVLAHQPRDYLVSIARGMAAYVRPGSAPPSVTGWGHNRLIGELHNPSFEQAAAGDIDAYYDGTTGHPRGDVRRLDRCGRIAKVEGLPTLVLALLMLASGLHPPGRIRDAACLLSSAVGSLTAGTVALLFYDVRYATPIYGPLAAAAALGADRIADVAESWLNR